MRNVSAQLLVHAAVQQLLERSLVVFAADVIERRGRRMNVAVCVAEATALDPALAFGQRLKASLRRCAIVGGLKRSHAQW